MAISTPALSHLMGNNQDETKDTFPSRPSERMWVLLDDPTPTTTQHFKLCPSFGCLVPVGSSQLALTGTIERYRRNRGAQRGAWEVDAVVRECGAEVPEPVAQSETDIAGLCHG